jgi:hypothetical protein
MSVAGNLDLLGPLALEWKGFRNIDQEITTARFVPRMGHDLVSARRRRAIGEFLLVRHPEVRQGFRELLIGPNATAFRGAIHDRLGDADPAVRHGAGMVLVTSDPSTEARALEEVVRSKSRQRFGGWHEWERFCLSLKFGPPVISHLESRLGSFTPESEVFALAILYRNGIYLDDSQFERLISGELTWVIGVDEPSEVTRSGRSLGVLLKICLQRAHPADEWESPRQGAENRIVRKCVAELGTSCEPF